MLRHGEAQHDDALILHARPLRDADLIVTWLGRNNGKCSGVAAHARRSRKRFEGGLQPGMIGRLGYQERPQRDLATLADWHVTQAPGRVVTTMPAFAAFGVIVNLVEQMSMERQASLERFDLATQTLRNLETIAPVTVLMQFLAAWLRACGFDPFGRLCVRCSAGFGNRAFFSPAEGGALCDTCDRRSVWTMPFPVVCCDAAVSMQWPDTPALRDFFRVGIGQQLRHLLGRELASAAYWEMVWQSSEGRGTI